MKDDDLHTKEDNIVDLDKLVSSIQSGESFAQFFRFSSDDLIEVLFSKLDLDFSGFQEKLFYFDDERPIHISKDMNGRYWISTMGLVARGKPTDNKFVNALASQRWVLKALLRSADEICSNDEIYVIDSYMQSCLEEITPALYANMIFFFELVGKAYLSISGANVKTGHRLNLIIHDVNTMMYQKHHDNTIFHAYIVNWMNCMAQYIGMIPGPFREAFIKYDDNPDDTTVIRFNKGTITELRNIVDISSDFIMEYYYQKDDTFYLHGGFYERMISYAESEEKRNFIRINYSFLINQSNEKRIRNL